MCHQHNSPKTKSSSHWSHTRVSLCHFTHYPLYTHYPLSVFPTSCHSLRHLQPEFLAICFFFPPKYNKSHKSTTINVQQLVCMGPTRSKVHIFKRFCLPFMSQQCSTVTRAVAGHTLFSQAHMFPSSNILLMPSHSFCK